MTAIPRPADIRVIQGALKKTLKPIKSEFKKPEESDSITLKFNAEIFIFFFYMNNFF